MSFNTGNGIGSSDVRDLKDNAEDFDILLNSDALSNASRLGVAKKTWSGLQNDFNQFLISSGFEANHLTYTAGQPLNVQRPTQLIDYNGSVYRVKMPATFPVALTGTWSTDAPKLVDVGDISLRQSLLSSSGTSLVSGPRGLLETELVGLHTADTTLQANIDALTLKTQPNVAQPLMTRSSNVTNQNQGVVVIGDSISHGAYAGNAYTNAYASLLAKAINQQFGASNLGVMPMDALYNPVSQYQTDQIHDVTWSGNGNWGPLIGGGASGVYNWPVGNLGAPAGDAVNGKTVSSSVSGAYFEFTVPSINKFINIFYVGIVGGGKFNVSVNGTVVTTLDTNVTTVKTYNLKYSLIGSDNGQGFMTIRFTKADALPTEIQPVIGYAKTAGDVNNHFPSMNVCNYSVSGRQLVTMTEAGIIAATNCAALVMALSYNDSQAETDDTYYATYVSRIDLLIKYANIFKCLVVVPDFCWYASPTSRRRLQLKRLAASTNGIYLGFPDKFYPDGSIVPDTSPSASALINPMALYADNAHPSFKMNEIIFWQIASAMGLGVRTRAQALLSDLPFPLRLAGTLQNKLGDISTVTRTVHGLRFSLGITGANGATLASGTVAGFTVPTKFKREGVLVRAASVVLASSSSGAIVNSVSVATDGSASLVVVTASVVEGSLDVSLNAGL